jgi:ATP-dependent DNA helicase RecQ
MELASLKSCTVRSVLDYFGESLNSDCGHCDRCLGESIPPVPPVQDPELTVEQERVIAELKKEQHVALAAPRQLARFLCGLPSPAASRARLTKDNRFGLLAHFRFASVLKLAHE